MTDLAVRLVQRLACGGVLRIGDARERGEQREGGAGDDAGRVTACGSAHASQHAMKPTSLAPKAARLGNTVARSDAGAPNQRASVAPYWSTAVVGIQRPRFSASFGPPSASVGYWPYMSPPFTASPMMKW